MEELMERLVSTSENLLLKYGQTTSQAHVKKLKDLVIVQLNGLYLKNVRHLQYCVLLKVCILSNNYITDIDALEYCTHLVKLDLHGNQIQHLPGPTFWEGMKELNLLYLHDNGIGKLDNVHSLSFCPNLIGLTLFDTPLSLRIAYRHIVVNSILSLKALDYYVISDEEIVENWKLPQKYKPFSPSFFLDFCHASRKEATIEEEINVVKDIIAKINHILAHHSPVVIVQRWIKGYLTRKRFGKIPLDEVLPQRYYIRDGAKQIYSQSTLPVCYSKSFMYHIIKPEQNTEDKKLTSGKQVLYMNNFKKLPVLWLRRKKQPVFSISSTLRKKEKKKKLEEQRIPVRKGFLDVEKPNMEEQVETKFRLSVCKAAFHSVKDKLMIFQKKEEEIWHAVHPFHSLVHPAPQLKAVNHPVSIEKRIFARMYGSVRLEPFYVIDKAYRESKRCEIQTKKICGVMQMQIAKGEADYCIKGFLKEKKNGVQKRCKEEDIRIQEALQQHQLRRSGFIEKVRQRHAQFLETKNQKASEYSLIQDFSIQHASLTQSLFRLDRLRRSEETIKERTSIVKENKEDMEKWKELIKNFQEQRQLMLRKENLAEKVVLDSIVSQKTSERLQQAKAKVAAVKDHQADMKIMIRLPLSCSAIKHV
ncbi:leucine-rich repeat and IQ domain-containing protein 3 [Malaclemys terrapin pileata]|uniref:leucine-rich repeat and IQ domain-containing protein 3 n=1 Tax=Malaclemys terrapin pileata TaxID=2991368 RepID=UPI0023A7D953|nr:leucine-rich repeat and IQ domain-containing protein 3 [Malaclemys terrapin pileata]XP_053893583.1 leucine-rich repeat and IQ domain-containing protein 3 [Malaclemys terrapin pileata]